MVEPGITRVGPRPAVALAAGPVTVKVILVLGSWVVIVIVEPGSGVVYVTTAPFSSVEVRTFF